MFVNLNIVNLLHELTVTLSTEQMLTTMLTLSANHYIINESNATVNNLRYGNQGHGPDCEQNRCVSPL